MARKATNKLNVKNSLVNNINAHKKRGDSKPKERSTISAESYEAMQEGWSGKRPRKAKKAARKAKKNPAKKNPAKKRATKRAAKKTPQKKSNAPGKRVAARK